MIGSRNGDAPEHDTAGPGAFARFELAYDRLADEDAKRSAYLDERIGWKRKPFVQCVGPECERRAVILGLYCNTHDMQRRRGQPLTRIEVKTPRTQAAR